MIYILPIYIYLQYLLHLYIYRNLLRYMGIFLSRERDYLLGYPKMKIKNK